jgi:hypothetical protein
MSERKRKSNRVHPLGLLGVSRRPSNVHFLETPPSIEREQGAAEEEWLLCVVFPIFQFRNNSVPPFPSFLPFIFLFTPSLSNLSTHNPREEEEEEEGRRKKKDNPPSPHLSSHSRIYTPNFSRLKF